MQVDRNAFCAGGHCWRLVVALSTAGVSMWDWRPGDRFSRRLLDSRGEDDVALDTEIRRTLRIGRFKAWLVRWHLWRTRDFVPEETIAQKFAAQLTDESLARKRMQLTTERLTRKRM